MKIYLYDTETDCIGSGSLSSAYVKSQLDAAAGADVAVHISSVGGSAFDAIAIYDLLKKYPGNVTTYIDALAASAASVVAMAGSKIVMSKYALLMIHKPMVGSGGNADELLKDVQMLNVVQSRLAQIYMDKSALEEAQSRLTKTREEVKNEIKSDFTPEGSKRSSKAKTEKVFVFISM